MAAGAAVEVHSRAEPIRHGFDRFEVSLAGIEEFQLPRRQPDDRSSRTRRPTPHARIARRTGGGGGIGTQHYGIELDRRVGQQQCEIGGQQSLGLEQRGDA